MFTDDAKTRGPALTARATQETTQYPDIFDKLPSLPRVLADDLNRGDYTLTPPLSTSRGVECSNLAGVVPPELMRASMYTVPADEDLYEVVGIPMLVLVQPFNDIVALPEFTVSYPAELGQCRSCKAFPAPSNSSAYKCAICGQNGEVDGEPATLLHHAVDYTVQKEALTDRSWYSRRELPKITAFPIPACRKWAEATVVFAIDVSLTSKSSAQFAEYLGGLQDLIESRDFALLYQRFAVVLIGSTPAVVSDTELGLAVNVLNRVEGEAGLAAPWLIEVDTMTGDKVTSLVKLIAEYPTDGFDLAAGLTTAAQLVSYTGGGSILLWLGRPSYDITIQAPLLQGISECGAAVHIFTPKTTQLHKTSRVAFATGGALEQEDIRAMVSDKVLRELFLRCTVRIVASNGLAKRAIYSCGFSETITGSLFSQMDAGTTLSISFGVDDFMREGAPVQIQTIVEYVDIQGADRVRVINMRLKASRLVQQLYAGMAFDTIFAGMCKYVASDPASMLDSVRKAEVAIVTALALYKKICAKDTASNQLVLPETIKVLPCILQSLLKYPKLHLGPAAKEELAGALMPLSVERTLRMFYPRLVKISSLFVSAGIMSFAGERLSMRGLSTDEGYILDAGGRVVFWFGHGAIDFADEMLESSAVTDALAALREAYGVHIKVLRRAQGEQDADFIGYMVEDQMGGYPKYQDYLGTLHTKVSRK
ncbi:protein transport protein SEC24 [Nematocida homosporus]|uniref:protein transport protein SEC24 n=1 Tax=Nematocida homosporus TaxID=1912981 RepID=UPI00221EE184|nr:protein transport protein SEC24 [Nematocida homosporus]KAI5187491.1 protein transport protein SEC24 [Nematocida homosporus]